jgi:hypothetical protein
MQSKKLLLAIAGCLLGVAAVGAMSSSKLSAAAPIKATLTEVVQPSHPYFARLYVPENSTTADLAVGPDVGTLGVTSIVFTNLTTTFQRVVIFQPLMSANAADCGGPIQSFGPPGSISMIVNLAPNETTSLPFPTPLVFNPINGFSCIAIEGAYGAVAAYVTGFVN